MAQTANPAPLVGPLGRILQPREVLGWVTRASLTLVKRSRWTAQAHSLGSVSVCQPAPPGRAKRFLV